MLQPSWFKENHPEAISVRRLLLLEAKKVHAATVATVWMATVLKARIDKDAEPTPDRGGSISLGRCWHSSPDGE